MAGYVELEDLKRTLELAGESYADDDLKLAINAASSAVDSTTGRSFSMDEADVTREYRTSRGTWVEVGDCAVVSGVTIDELGRNEWTPLTEGTDYVLQPVNHVADDWPATSIELVQTGAVSSFCPYPYYGNSDKTYQRWPSIRVTGKFGWPEVPDSIKAATMILATRFVKRVREAPFGVAGMGADGIAVRIAAGDPDVAMLCAPYTRPARLA